MRKIQILGAFIAVLALSALTIANASATKWLKNGKEITKEESADTTGTLVLNHTGGLAGTIEVDCTGTFHGTVGPGALDLITEVLGLLSTELNLVSCKILKRGNCYSESESLVTVHAINLPWHTLLELMTNGVTLDHFLAESGKEAGYEFPCPRLIFNGNCAGLDTSDFLENGASGAIFHNLGLSKQKCSDGGEGFTLGLGEAIGYTVS